LGVLDPSSIWVNLFEILESVLIFLLDFVFTFYIFFDFQNLEFLVWFHLLVIVFILGSLLIRSNLSYFENGDTITNKRKIILKYC
jgi:hypothetical protein